MASRLVSLFVTELRMRRSSRQSSRPSRAKSRSGDFTTGDQKFRRHLLKTQIPPDLLNSCSNLLSSDQTFLTMTRSHFMYARISACLLVLALVLTAHVNAQERFGTLQGRVTDQQGASIPGVTVAVTSLSSGETRTFVTDSNGQFLAADLNPGRYKVSLRSQWVHPRRTSRRQRRPRTHLRGEHRDERRGIDRIGAGHRRVAARRQPQHAHRAQRQRRGVRSPAEGTVVPVDRADRAVGERR